MSSIEDASIQVCITFSDLADPERTAGPADRQRRPYSSVIVDGLTQTSRAMLRAVGFDDDFKTTNRIASTWSMVACNMHINQLADTLRKVRTSGAKAVVFNTITVSDGISMGTPGCATVSEP